MMRLLVGLCPLLLVGCASTPPLVYKYYPSKATTQVTVTQTIDCDADKRLIILNTPSISPAVYSSDRSRATSGSGAAPTTSMSGCELMISFMMPRISAESSTINTLIFILYFPTSFDLSRIEFDQSRYRWIRKDRHHQLPAPTAGGWRNRVRD